MNTDEIMALADAYATAVAQQGEAHDHIARDTLRAALAEPPAEQEPALKQALTDPENQPNQFGVEFLMRGPKFAFKVGVQQFTLDYEPEEPGEFEFMRDALIHAFSTFTPDVKAEQPAEPQREFLQFLTDVVTAAGLLSHGKTDKALAARISEFAFNLRTAPPTPEARKPAKRAPLTEQEAMALCKTGPVYAPDGAVTRTPQQYRQEIEAARMHGIRKAEAAHGITSEANGEAK